VIGMFAVVVALAGVTLVASPGDDQQKYTPQTVTEAEQRLATAGQVLGAASMCKDIDRARVKAAVTKVEAMIDKGVDDNRQYYASKNIFDKGLDKGKSAIKHHETDCRHATEDLVDLEKVLGP
jgi:hypothetical protein